MKKRNRKFAEQGGQARVLAYVSYRLVRPLLMVLLALASVVMLPLTEFAAAEARFGQAVCSIGISPTSMNTSGLPQSTVINYDKNFVANLKANTCALRCCERRELPEQSGNQHRMYMYSPLGANVGQTSEGVVGAGITVSVLSTTATIGQIADYVNFSDLSLATAIDPALENTQRELAYRLGLSLTKLVINTADGAAAIDSSVDDLSLLYNESFTRQVITSAVQSLAGRNVQPFSNSRMTGMIHPFLVGDAINDTANNGITDILKRTAEGQEKLSELPSPDGDEVPVLEWGGVSFHQTTLVTQTANYAGQGGTAFRTYIMGKDAIIAISLGKKENSQIGDGDWRNLKLWMMRAGEPSVGDPARVIGGWTSYNVKFTVSLPPDLTQRLRAFDAQAIIA